MGIGTSKLFYFFSRSVLYGVGEVCFLLGNCLPVRFALLFWQFAIRLNPHHVAAALNIAAALVDNGDNRAEHAWAAFIHVQTLLQNPWNTSGSDLYLTWLPSRIVRKVIFRMLWGRIPSAHYLVEVSDRIQQDSLARLAEKHTRLALGQKNLERADQSLAIWRAMGSESLLTRWAAIELAKLGNNPINVVEQASPLVIAGEFISPLDTLVWAEYFLVQQQDIGAMLKPLRSVSDIQPGALAPINLARTCLDWAKKWIPEVAQVWSLSARLAQLENDREPALFYWQRALALRPDNLADFLSWLAMQKTGHHSIKPISDGHIKVSVPEQLAVGAVTKITCELQNVSGAWMLYGLPPTGWGIITKPTSKAFNESYKVELDVYGLRADWIIGKPWTLRLVAVGEVGYLSSSVQISVTDPQEGKILVAITEDHEIQEERGLFSAVALEQLLVTKSEFAASLAKVPWTHMIEVGSTLFMPEWLAQQESTDAHELRNRIRQHLINELDRGNGLEPHLHTFNDPLSSRFPFQRNNNGWQPSLLFLLTEPTRRGDWASACPAPSAAVYNRLYSVEHAVAHLERLGRSIDPDYQPILWRSGLLEFGDTQADRAWSTVALRRAGLLADSDMSKPGSPFKSNISAAFLAGWSTPFELDVAGPLLQLPITANLEGDFLMDTLLLRRRATHSIAALRRTDGSIRPGTHLFTVLTHDKFINARARRKELQLSSSYGDWHTITQHVAIWQAAGSRFVTAREGIEAVLDERVLGLQSRLCDETFITNENHQHTLRYRIKLLGQGIPISEEYPQNVLVTIPPSIRSSTIGVKAYQNTIGQRGDISPLVSHWNASDSYFWIILTQRSSATFCELELVKPLGPIIQTVVKTQPDRWLINICFTEIYPQVKILLPWGWLENTSSWDDHRWHADGMETLKVTCAPCPQGILLIILQSDKLSPDSVEAKVVQLGLRRELI